MPLRRSYLLHLLTTQFSAVCLLFFINEINELCSVVSHCPSFILSTLHNLFSVTNDIIDIFQLLEMLCTTEKRFLFSHLLILWLSYLALPPGHISMCKQSRIKLNTNVEVNSFRIQSYVLSQRLFITPCGSDIYRPHSN